MIALATFGICLAITVAFLLVLGMLLGPSFFMLFIFLPVLVSEAITGQRGSFHPNGATKKAPFFEGVMLFSIVLQVLFLTAILFGIYWLIAGLAPTPTITEDVAIGTLRTPEQISSLLVANNLLWLLAVSFFVMLVVNVIRYWKEIKLMPKGKVLLGYIIPFLLFLFVFYFLFSSRNYLMLYPQGASHLSGFLQATAICYGVYLLIFKLRDIYLYFSIFRKYRAPVWKGYWFTMSVSIVYTILYQYYLIQLLLSV